MGRIELSEENEKKTSCLSSIFSVFSSQQQPKQEEHINEKNTYPPYSDIEPVYTKMANLDINENELEQIINKQIDSISKELREISLDLHENWETGFKEFHAHDLVTDYLEKKGFKVTRHAFGLETAFTAEYSNGQGRRVGVCSEYDALAGLGHGCGHNLICISGVATAMAIKSVLESGKAKGKVVLFGTPSEENLTGKVILTSKRAFQDNVDVCMMLHPYATDGQYPTFLACNDVHVEFFGKASHASAAPWEGINALDAIVQTWNGISMMRQQILPTDRIHGIITDGGQAPNVIPEHAAAYFYIRALKTDRLVELMKILENIFEAASIATGAKVKYQWREAGIAKEVISNRPMADFYAKIMNKHGIEFPSEDFQERAAGGSTDMGNVSYEMPVIHPMFGIHTNASNHTIDFVAAAKTPEAHEDTIKACKGLAATAVQVLVDEEFYSSIQKNFKETMSSMGGNVPETKTNIDVEKASQNTRCHC